MTSPSRARSASDSLRRFCADFVERREGAAPEEPPVLQDVFLHLNPQGKQHMTMQGDPRAPRGLYTRMPEHERYNNTLGWVLGVLAVLVIVGAIYWGMSDRTHITTSDPPTQTTGEGAGPGTPNTNP